MESYEKIIRRLIENNKKVFVLYPIPELNTHVKKLVTPGTIFDTQINQGTSINLNCNFSNTLV